MILRDALETYSALCTDDYVEKVIDAVSADAATIAPGLIKPPSSPHQHPPSRCPVTTPHNFKPTDLDNTNPSAKSPESIHPAQTLRAVIPIKHASPSSAQPLPSNIPVDQNTVILRVPKDLMLDELDFDKPLPPIQGHTLSQTPHPPPPKRRKISKPNKNNRHPTALESFPNQRRLTIKPSNSRRLPHATAPKKRKPLPTPSRAPPLPKAIGRPCNTNGRTTLPSTEPSPPHLQPTHAAKASPAPSHGNALDPVIVPDSSSSSESAIQPQPSAAPCKASDQNDYPHRRSTVLHRPGARTAPAQSANQRQRRSNLQDMRHLPIVKRYTLDKSKSIPPPRKPAHTAEQHQNHSPSYTFLSPKAAICDVPPRPASAVGSTRNSSERLPDIPCSLNLTPQREHKRSSARKSSPCPLDQRVPSPSGNPVENLNGTVDRSPAKPPTSAALSLSRRQKASIVPPVKVRDTLNRTDAIRDQHDRQSVSMRQGAALDNANGIVGHLGMDAELAHVPDKIDEQKLLNTAIVPNRGAVSRQEGRLQNSSKPKAPAASGARKTAATATSNHSHTPLPVASTLRSLTTANNSGVSLNTSDKRQLSAPIQIGARSSGVAAEPPVPTKPWTEAAPFQNRTGSHAHPSTQHSGECAPSVEPLSESRVPCSGAIEANKRSVEVSVVSPTSGTALSFPAKERRPPGFSNETARPIATSAQGNTGAHNQPSSVHTISKQAKARRAFREGSKYAREPAESGPAAVSTDVQNLGCGNLENVKDIENQSPSSGLTDARIVIGNGRSSIQDLPGTATGNCASEVPPSHPLNARPTPAQGSRVCSAPHSIQPRHRDQEDNTVVRLEKHTPTSTTHVAPNCRIAVTQSGKARGHELSTDASRKLNVQLEHTQTGQNASDDKNVRQSLQSSPHRDVPANESTAEAGNIPVNVKELQWDAKREALLAFAQVQRKLAGNMQLGVKHESNEGAHIARHVSRNRNVPETERLRMESTELAASSRLRQSSHLPSNNFSTRKGSISSLLHVNPESPSHMCNVNGKLQENRKEIQNSSVRNQEVNVTLSASYQGRDVGFRRAKSLRSNPYQNIGQKRTTRARESARIDEDRLHYQTSARYGRASGSLSSSHKAVDRLHPLRERCVPSSTEVNFRHQLTMGGLSSWSQGHGKHTGSNGYNLANSAPSGNLFSSETYTANGNLFPRSAQTRYHPQQESEIQSLPSASNLRLPRPGNGGQNEFPPYNDTMDDVRRLAPVAFPPRGSASGSHPYGSPPAIEPMEMPPFGRPGDPIRYNDQPAKKYRMGPSSQSGPVQTIDKSRVPQANELVNGHLVCQETTKLREANYTRQHGFSSALSRAPPRRELNIPFGLHGRPPLPNPAEGNRVKEPSTKFAVLHVTEPRQTALMTAVSRPRRFSVPYVQPETRRAQFEQGKALAFVGTSQGGHGLSSRRFNDIGLRTDSPMLHRSAVQTPSQRVLGLASIPEPRLPLQIQEARDALPDLNTSSDRYADSRPGLQPSGTLGRSERPGPTLDRTPQLDALPDSGLSLSKQIRALASQPPQERRPLRTTVTRAPPIHYGNVTGEKPLKQGMLKMHKNN